MPPEGAGSPRGRRLEPAVESGIIFIRPYSLRGAFDILYLLRRFASPARLAMPSAESCGGGVAPRSPAAPPPRKGGSQLLELKLEITTGPLAGKVIPVREGQALTIGRTQRSNFPIPQDTFLSGVHFSVECDGAACRLVDHKSANGTF